MLHAFSAPVLRRRPLWVLISGLVAAAIVAPTPASAGIRNGWILQIDDGVSLGPTDSEPDSVLVGGIAAYPGDDDDAFPIPSIERGGSVIVGGGANPEARTDVHLADLRPGDEIVVHDWYSPGHATELFRYTYKKGIAVDAPVCSGQQVYVGSRTAGSGSLYGSTASWTPTPPGSGDYGDYGDYGGGDGPSLYPGGGNGFMALGGALGKVAAVGTDRFSFDASRPTAAGMQLVLSESFSARDKLFISLRTEQTVVNCPPPMLPATTPATTPVVTTMPPVQMVPPKDTAAPNAIIAALKASTLKKLGLKKLLDRGLPITLTLDEAGKVTARISLVKRGKKKASTLFTDTQAVGKGTNALQFAFSKKNKKTIGKAGKRAKLKIEITVTDAAGNTKVLPAVTVTIPS